MSSLLEFFTTSTHWTTLAVESVTATVTVEPTPVTTFTTSTWLSLKSNAPAVVVQFNGTVEIPSTGDSMYWSQGALGHHIDMGTESNYGNGLVPLLPNADIAGFGVSTSVCRELLRLPGADLS
jgi:hypothetical protein